MADRISRDHRSWNMSQIRGMNTKPEKAVRSLLHKMGFRFRLHRRDLPGSPDIVLPKHNSVIFVHGCFWHRHRGCKLAYTPKTRKTFWLAKFQGNVERDQRVQGQLRRAGWRVTVIWECQVNDLDKIARRIERFLAKKDK